MALPEPFRCFIEPLENAQISYCVTGSVAAGIYGDPRPTRDIDIVLLVRMRELPKFREAFPIESYHVPPIEVLVNELARGQRGCLNLYHHATGFKCDLFFVVRDALHLWAIENRQLKDYSGSQICVAPPEYVILRKLEYFREGQQDKHIRDVCFMLAVTKVDRSFIARHVERLGLQAQWEELIEAFRQTGGTALE